MINPITSELDIKSLMRRRLGLKCGVCAKGKTIDIHNSFHTFDGTIPHAVIPLKGI